MLAALVYSMPNLNWMDPKDHTELFSGCGSVTRGELQAWDGGSNQIKK